MSYRYSNLIIFTFFILFISNISQAGKCELSQLVISKDPLVKIDFCNIPYSTLNNSTLPISEKESGKSRKSNYFDFEVGKFELTQEQFSVITGRKPWNVPYSKYSVLEVPGGKKQGVISGPMYPAVYINGYDVQEVLEKLNKLDPKHVYRLPTHNEWFWYTKARVQSTFYWGEELGSDFVFHGSTKEKLTNAQKVTSCPDKEKQKIIPEYCANPFGLMHTLGNVWELTDNGVFNGSKSLSSPLDIHMYEIEFSKVSMILAGGSWTTDQLFFSGSFTYKLGMANNDGQNNVGIRLLRIKK